MRVSLLSHCILHMLKCDLLMLQGIYPRRAVIDDDTVGLQDSTLYDGVDVYTKLCVYGGLFSVTDNTFSKDGLQLPKKFIVKSAIAVTPRVCHFSQPLAIKLLLTRSGTTAPGSPPRTRQVRGFVRVCG